ncbi:heparinase II/III family protein [Motiliproteus sp.]|uniref:heparinase II/III family protein n=1 Tax=Motiliproteus sp. TaxID=1898955 RepID=UPI003BAD7743
MKSACLFQFLNEHHELRGSNWDKAEWSKLWRYNLHYFDDLNAIGAPDRETWHHLLLERWVHQNPPGTGTGWEPYPTSLRIVNWIKWSLAGHQLTDEQLQSLAIQVRWLSRRLERHILGNHLLANAKALVFAGLFFEGPEADRWLKCGIEILADELYEQILPDGGHFELSPMYQAIVIEDLLDLVNLSSIFDRNPYPLPVSDWIMPLQKMIDWLRVMTHPDGGLSFFNDSALGISAELRVLEAYAKLLNIDIRPLEHSACHRLADSGYLRANIKPATLLVDMAHLGPDYLPAHGHADTLSFELSLSEQRFLVNSGISCYGVGTERQRQRGTAAHNTLIVDQADSSEVWGGFRVGRRAAPEVLQVESSVGAQGESIDLGGAHNGYEYLVGKPTHYRHWQLTKSGLRVSDSVQGGFKHAQARFHIHPDWLVELDGRGGMARCSDGKEVRIEVLSGQPRLEYDQYHPEFGLSVTNRCLSIDAEAGRVSVEFRW